MAHKPKSKIRATLIWLVQLIKDIISFLCNLLISFLNLIGIAAE